jgi:hypothetical protein
MSTAPAFSAGETAEILVAEFTMKLVAGALPKLTAVAPVKLVPVMMTEVPPAVVPVAALMPVTTGAGM